MIEEVTKQDRASLRERREHYIALYMSSDLTQKAFCEEHGLNYGTMRGWLKRHRRSQVGNASTFVPVMVEESTAPGTIRIITRGGTVVEVPSTMAITSLSMLVEQLDKLC